MITQQIPPGITYAIFSAVGTVLIGGIVLKQLPNLPALFGITLTFVGVILLHQFSAEAHES